MPRESRLSLRISPKLRTTAEKMAKHHGTTITQYVEGVITLDALLQLGNQSGLKAEEMPVWLLMSPTYGRILKELRSVVKKQLSRSDASTLMFPDEG